MKLIHLSDLHFGTETPEITNLLRQAIEPLKPDLIIISGDFTQTASTREFIRARKFIDSLPAPVFCVPGNHDVPPFDLWQRFLRPYKKYKRYITEDLFPVHVTKSVVIAGINSARRFVPHWNWANGAISSSQLAHLKETFEKHPGKARICVFHHPIHVSLNAAMRTVVFGAREALQTLNELGVDLVLTGHVHHASVTTMGDINHKTLYLSASTALSSRLRQQENGFNVIDISRDKIHVDIFTRDGTSFSAREKYSHELQKELKT